MDTLIKLNIHSVVDVITNSSTTVFIYQNCVDEVKELVQEMLNLSSDTDKTPSDVFHYGVFAEDHYYMDHISDEEDEEDVPQVTASYDTPEYKEQIKKQKEWLLNLKISIIKGEIEKPDWMERAETNYDEYEVGTELNLIVKDENYAQFVKKIQKLLNGVTADGYNDG
jgi:hypothetical protein